LATNRAILYHIMHIYSILTFRYIFCNALFLLILSTKYIVYEKYINCIDSSPASSTEKPPFRGLFNLRVL